MNAQESKAMKMMRIAVPFMLGLALWLFLFWAGSVFAQPTVTRGGALKKRQFQTYSAMSLYVNADGGSDFNPCSSAAPCATIQAAVNRIPYWVRHDVTVNIEPIWNPDGGPPDSYMEDVLFSNHYIGDDEKLGTTSYPRITFAGSNTWTPSTVTGGSTGTVTSYTEIASTGMAPVVGAGNPTGILTDASKTWTTVSIASGLNFVRMTSGAGEGVRSAVHTNTATALYVNFPLGASPGDSFVIERPSTTIIGSFTVEGLYGHADAQRGAVLLESLSIGNTTGQVISVRNTIKPGWVKSAGDLDSVRPNAAVVLHWTRLISTSTADRPVFSCIDAACGFRGANIMYGTSKYGLKAVNAVVDLGAVYAISGKNTARTIYLDSSKLVASLYDDLAGGVEFGTLTTLFPVLDAAGTTAYALYLTNKSASFISYLVARAGAVASTTSSCVYVDHSQAYFGDLYGDQLLGFMGLYPDYGVQLVGGELYAGRIGGDIVNVLNVTKFSNATIAVMPISGIVEDLLIDGEDHQFSTISALTPNYFQGIRGSKFNRE